MSRGRRRTWGQPASGSPIFTENFEGTGTPANWFRGNSANFDSVSPILSGAQSLKLTGSTTDYAVWQNFGGLTEIWVKFLFRLETSLPASFSHMFTMEDAGFNNLYNVAILSSGVLECTCFTVNIDTVSAIAPDTTYYVWCHYKAGSGSNALFDVGFSTTNSKPTSGNNYASGTNGTSTGSVDHFNLRCSDVALVDDFDDVQYSAGSFS